MVAINQPSTSADSVALALSTLQTLLVKVKEEIATEEERRQLRKLLKWNRTRLTKHHRVPRARGGTDESRNIAFVPNRTHVRFHALFGIMTPFEIAQMLNEMFIDPDYKMVVVKRA
jgi:hypothetical protein